MGQKGALSADLKKDLFQKLRDSSELRELKQNLVKVVEDYSDKKFHLSYQAEKQELIRAFEGKICLRDNPGQTQQLEHLLNNFLPLKRDLDAKLNEELEKQLLHLSFEDYPEEWKNPRQQLDRYGEIDLLIEKIPEQYLIPILAKIDFSDADLYPDPSSRGNFSQYIYKRTIDGELWDKIDTSGLNELPFAYSWIERGKREYSGNLNNNDKKLIMEQEAYWSATQLGNLLRESNSISQNELIKNYQNYYYNCLVKLAKQKEAPIAKISEYISIRVDTGKWKNRDEETIKCVFSEHLRQLQRYKGWAIESKNQALEDEINNEFKYCRKLINKAAPWYQIKFGKEDEFKILDHNSIETVKKLDGQYLDDIQERWKKIAQEKDVEQLDKNYQTVLCRYKLQRAVLKWEQAQQNESDLPLWKKTALEEEFNQCKSAYKDALEKDPSTSNEDHELSDLVNQEVTHWTELVNKQPDQRTSKEVQEIFTHELGHAFYTWRRIRMFEKNEQFKQNNKISQEKERLKKERENAHIYYEKLVKVYEDARSGKS